jgi:lipoate-protein ligase A
MQILDLTLKTPAENLACDEALLDLCEDGHSEEILRFWESPESFVVLGYSNKVQTEVDADACRKDGIPILRRPSGGGTVLQGAGCLNYSLILRITPKGPLSNLIETNCFVLSRHSHAMTPLLGNQVKVQGISDLTLGPLKFSGNAQRRKRHFLLFHGTFLYNFDLDKISRYLKSPSRQPDYREQRPHESFVTNVELKPEQIKESLKKEWDASEKFSGPLNGAVSKLAAERYSKPEWNFKF